MKSFKLDWLVLPLVGFAAVLLLWSFSSSTWASNLPSPAKTWEASRDYVMQPFAKRGEMDQGILRFTWYSLILVAQGYASPKTLAITGGSAGGIFAGRAITAAPQLFAAAVIHVGSELAFILNSARLLPVRVKSGTPDRR